MLPGLKRTSPLNIQATTARSVVETAKCGSSRPTSCAAMPTVRVVFGGGEGGQRQHERGGQQGGTEHHGDLLSRTFGGL